MKYAEIDIKIARKCCKAHSERVKGQRIVKCETCPLERKGKFCWYILADLYSHADKMKMTQEFNCIFKQEYDELMEEDIEKITEWEEWINKQESQE